MENFTDFTKLPPPFPLFGEDSFEWFPAQTCSVIEPISASQRGWVKVKGVFWRAELHPLASETTLLPGQPAVALGRRNNILIVIPRDHSQVLQDLAASG
jgi:hypothetical protein